MPALQTETPARLPAEERRRQIIEVAIDLFARRGFKGTTTREIAAAAGVTEAIIFRHFATKEQLYTAILESRHPAEGGAEWMAQLERLMEARDDRALFQIVIATIIGRTREDAKFERLITYAALEGHELATIWQEQFAMPIVAPILDYIARRQKEGALRAAHPKAIFFALAGMAKQYATHAYMSGYSPGFSDEEAVATFTDILMAGICQPGSTGKSR